NKTGIVDVTTWEDLRMSGRILVKRILEEIQNSEVVAADVTTLNENVLFELGYAIALGKIPWILLDRTDAEARKLWKEFRLLKGVWFSGWANAEEIRGEFFRQRPDNAESNLYDDLIEPELSEMTSGSLFYVQTYHNTEAARLIARRLDQEMRRGVRLIASDPTESSINPLQWYAAKAYETEATLVHFEAPRRVDAQLHNRRAALVGGLAAGLGRPLLMLAEQDYSPPLDYEDLLRSYSSARECVLLLYKWLLERNLTPRAGARTP